MPTALSPAPVTALIPNAQPIRFSPPDELKALGRALTEANGAITWEW